MGLDLVCSVTGASSLVSYGKCGPPEVSSWEGILLIHIIVIAENIFKLLFGNYCQSLLKNLKR